MDRTSSGWTKLATLCLAALAAFHLYRARVLPVTVDEAFTFSHFVVMPWPKLLSTYDANHHVFHSMLCKLSVGAFGAAEWSLRLPAVLGGWGYLFFALRVARQVCGVGAAVLAAVLWMACLPQIAEYLSLARGYSLGLAFFTAALSFSLEEKPALRRISVCLGFSAASNLVFLIPSAALGLLLWRRERRFAPLASPAAGVLVCFLAVPLQYASQSNYYFGAKTWESMIHSLLLHPWLKSTAAALLLLALWRARGNEQARWIVSIFALSLAFAGALFAFLDVPLPYERTGIYLLMLLGVMAGIAVRMGRLEVPATLLLTLGALSMAVRLSPSQSAVWTFDSFNRAAVRTIRSDARFTPRVAASFPLEHSLEFYRISWALPWPAVLQWRAGTPADYLVWRTDEGQGSLPAGFEPLARDTRSGVIVGRRRGLPGR